MSHSEPDLSQKSKYFKIYRVFLLKKFNRRQNSPLHISFICIDSLFGTPSILEVMSYLINSLTSGIHIEVLIAKTVIHELHLQTFLFDNQHLPSIVSACRRPVR